MIDFEKGIVWDGKYRLYHSVGKWYAIVDDTPSEIKAEVESYLASHPEALVDEPAPPEPTAEQKAAAIRAQRNALLSACDWTMLSDTAVDKDDWGDYRQVLRDVTDQATFPDSVEWPVKPT